MGDTNTDVDVSGDASVEMEGEETTSQNNSSEDSAEAGDDASEETGSSDAKPDSSDDAKQSEEDAEPPVRPRTNADWVALRRQKKIEKMQQGDKSGNEDSPDEEQDRFDPRVDELLKEREAAEIDKEIADFVKENPEFGEFAEKAKRWSQHESRQNVPVRSIMFELAGAKLMKIGAERARQADREAKESRTGGGSYEPESGNKSYQDMPLDEFEQELNRVLQGGQ